MQLSQKTISEFDKLIAEKRSKLLSCRHQLLDFVTVDRNDNLCIDPELKKESKSLINEISLLQSGIQDIIILKEEVLAASETLGYSDFDMARQRFKHIMAQNDIVLKKGIINETLSKEKCMDLEILINDAKSKLKELEAITDPIISKIAHIQEKNT